ncbi:MAG TPA: cytochrome c peroxidase [Burkholderiales bacterium]|nr:cytochrome c peroxidase [Burkholderiales bacterium]
MKARITLLLAALALTAMASASDFGPAEIRKILPHGPWPPPLRADPSNRVSGRSAAIELGERLFFEPRLSGTGSVLCATCHVPFRGFQDARPRAFGLEQVERNTPSLLNARFNRRFGWDGARDSLWAQSIRPLLEPREMRATPAHVAEVMRKNYSNEYEAVFGRSAASDEEILVDVGKALAAFQETLITGRTPFDDFRDALERGDDAAAAGYPLAARRGLRIFVGKGNCSACHSGPQFTNGGFVDSGAPFLVRVPGLRDVARTAPYMHDGRLATLRDVVRFHPERNAEHLSERELEELVAFLESLTGM